jgi:ribose transport system ATP-binding protein
MIGRAMRQQYPAKNSIKVGEEILRLESFGKKKSFQNINLQLKRGEIVGIAGLLSSRKNDLIRCMFGILPYDSGKIFLYGKEANFKSIHDAKNMKLAFIPAERKREALFGMQDVKWNITIASLEQLRPRFIKRNAELNCTKKYIDNLWIKTSGPKQKIQNLSGGNQQKVILSRWLMTEPEVILMEEPTRGIDVNAKVDVYKLINDCAKNGKAVCVVSSENEELLGICDRIIVMHNGVLRKELIPDETNLKELTYYTVTKGGGIDDTV